jgi:hypothetical protein
VVVPAVGLVVPVSDTRDCEPEVNIGIPLNYGRSFKMRISFLKAIISMSSVLVLASVLLAQTGQQNGAGKTKSVQPAPKRDISGTWVRGRGDPSLSSIHSLTGVGRGPGFVDMPPLTPWGQEKFDSNRPGYGIRQQPEGNDPDLRCMPAGVPRLIWGVGELIQLPNKVVQILGSTWRQIATDGRPLKVDPPELRYDTGWMGVSVGHWEDDYTFVVESAGFNDKTWISEEGIPHSDEMKLEERYTRLDHDTLLFNATIYDPKTFTTPYKVTPATLKLRPSGVRVANFCNPDNEALFQERIRSQAIKTPDADGNIH